MNPYIGNILEQPAALRRLVESFTPQPLELILSAFKRNRYDRIILTGMGASYSAACPTEIALSQLPIPVILVNSSELVHYKADLIGPRSLVWMNSQSGRSAELVHLLEVLKSTPGADVLVCVNERDSPLAHGADLCLPIFAGPEATVGTKTYLNTVAANLLAAVVLVESNLAELKSDILETAGAIEDYLGNMDRQVAEMDAGLGNSKNLIVLGRGPSMGAVWTGALITKEAAKFPLEGMHAAEFRHGPLELAEPGFTALVLAGAPETIGLNRKLALDIIEHGGRVLWIDDVRDPELDTIQMPRARGLVRSLAEILPLQILTLVLANRRGVEAGKFRYLDKVTVVE
ncbi:MAG: SIS domain-containing protein [Anaerolineales bacterium]|nr:SIS domain-containing protein [Anaerolineales bacterium]